MELFLDPQEKIQCPYDPSHHIMLKKMNTHLVKCTKQNSLKSKMVPCDFNVNHKVLEPELQYHHKKCPDRRKIESTVYQEEGVVLNQYPIRNVHVDAEGTKSWDNDNVATYDWSISCEENGIIRRLDVASAAEKRDFRLNQRHRFRPKKNNRPVQQVQPQVNSKSSTTPRKTLPERPSGTVEERIPDTVDSSRKK